MAWDWFNNQKYKRELKSGGSQLLRKHLESGGDPDHLCQMTYPISIAVNHHNLEAVKLLLAHGATTSTPEVDINDAPDEIYRGVTKPEHLTGYKHNPRVHAITDAAFHGYADIVSLLLDHGVPVDDYYIPYTTGLHEACMMRCGHDCVAWDFPCKWGDPADDARFLETVRLLLDAGADVDATCDIWPGPQARYTPIHFAVASCNLPIVKLLVERGADLSIPDDGGKTPMETALHIQKVAPDYRKRTKHKYEIDPIVEYLKLHLK